MLGNGRARLPGSRSAWEQNVMRGRQTAGREAGGQPAVRVRPWFACLRALPGRDWSSRAQAHAKRPMGVAPMDCAEVHAAGCRRDRRLPNGCCGRAA